MNGFELHNQTHTSASSINLWHNAPDVWIAEKLYGFKGKMSPAALRGIEIEKAIVKFLMKEMDIEEAIRQAVDSFNRQTALNSSDKTNDERDMIDPCVRQGVEILLPYGVPTFDLDQKQKRIELLCKTDKFEIPVIGFIDLWFENENIIFDIKTTGRIPSKMSPEHNRQCAIYKKASGNAVVKFLYLSGKKTALHECEDMSGTLAEIKGILTRQEHFLSKGTKEELAQLVRLYPETFYWTGNEETRKTVYGF